MKKPGLVVLGGLLSFALIAAGCSSSGGGGSGGSGGGAGKGGSGGGGTGGGGSGGKGGTGGGGTGGGGTGGGTGGATDGGTGGTTDGGGGTGPCTTSFGAGNQLLYAFDNGANIGWVGEVDNASLNASFGGTTTDGHTCPGAITLTVYYMNFGDPNADVSINYGTAKDWSAYSKLHVWVKLKTTNYGGVNGVQPFILSNAYAAYTNGSFAGGGTFSDGNWHELVLDMTTASTPVVRNIVNKFGVQVLAKGAATDGGPPAPTTVEMLVDDIWLEKAPPPPDAGPDSSGDATSGGDATSATDSSTGG